MHKAARVVGLASDNAAAAKDAAATKAEEGAATAGAPVVGLFALFDCARSGSAMTHLVVYLLVEL